MLPFFAFFRLFIVCETSEWYICSKNRNTMTQLIFRDNIEGAKISTLLDFLKTWGIDVEVKHTPAETTSSHDVFADVRGMWADYDIDVKQIRKQNRERRTKISV